MQIDDFAQLEKNLWQLWRLFQGFMHRIQKEFIDSIANQNMKKWKKWQNNLVNTPYLVVTTVYGYYRLWSYGLDVDLVDFFSFIVQ
jgi:beta-galactosidase GanA